MTDTKIDVVEADRGLFYKQLVSRQKIVGQQVECHSLKCDGLVNFDHNLVVSGNLKLNSGLSSSAGITVYGDFTAKGDVDIGPLTVSGPVNVAAGLHVNAGVTLLSELYVSGDVHIGNELSVSGRSCFQALSVLTGATLQGIQCRELKVSGDTTLQSNLSVAEDLDVRGQSTFHNGMKVDGAVTLESLHVGGDTIFKGHTTTRCLQVMEQLLLHDNLTVSGNVKITEDVSCYDLQAEDVTCNSIQIEGGQLDVTQLKTSIFQADSVTIHENLVTKGGLIVKGTSSLASTQVTKLDAGPCTAQSISIHGNLISQNGQFKDVRVRNGLSVGGKLKGDTLAVTSGEIGSLVVDKVEVEDVTASFITVPAAEVGSLQCGEATVDRLTTSAIHIPKGHTLTIGDKHDSVHIDRLTARYIDGAYGGGLTIATAVNVLGDLTTTGVIRSTQQAIDVAHFSNILPPEGEECVKMGSVDVNGSLAVGKIVPNAGNVEIKYGQIACNNVFEDRLTVPTVYAEHLRSTKGMVDVKPGLAVLGPLQLETVKSAKKKDDLIHFDNSQGQTALSLGLKQCNGTKRDPTDAFTTIEAPNRLHLVAGKGVIRAMDHIQTSKLSALPGKGLDIQASHVRTNHLQPTLSTTLAYLNLSGKKRAQWDLTGPGAVLQTTDGGSFLIKARSNEVVMGSNLRTGNILPHQDSLFQIGKAGSQFKEVHSQEVHSNRVKTQLIQADSILDMEVGCQSLQFHIQDDDVAIQAKSSNLVMKNDIQVKSLKSNTTVVSPIVECDKLSPKEVVADHIHFTGCGTKSIHLDMVEPAIRFQDLSLKGDKLHLDVTTSTKDIQPDQDGTYRMGSNDRRYKTIYTTDIDMTGDLTVPTLYITELHGTDKDMGLQIGTPVKCPSMRTTEIKTDQIKTDSCQVKSIESKNEIQFLTQSGFHTFCIDHDPDLDLSLLITKNSTRLGIMTDKLELDTKQLLCVQPDFTLQASSTLHLKADIIKCESESVMCDRLVTSHLASQDGQIHIEDSVKIPTLDVDQMECQGCHIQELKTSHIQTEASVIHIDDMDVNTGSNPGIKVDTDFTIQASSLHVPTTYIDSCVHVPAIDCGQRLQIGRLSIHPGTATSTGCVPTTLCADDAQNVVIDTHELDLVNNLRVRGNMYCNQICPTKSTILGLGWSDQTVEVAGNLDVRGNLDVTSIQSDQSIHVKSESINLNDIQIIDDQVTAGTVVADSVQAAKWKVHDQGIIYNDGKDDFFIVKSDSACRMNTFKKPLVFESDKVRVTHDFQVFNQFTSEKADCNILSTNIANVDRVRTRSGAAIKVTSPIQFYGGVAGTDNQLSIQDKDNITKLTIDTSSNNPCLRSNGGLRLSTDGPMIHIERSVRSQDIIPDQTGTRQLGRDVSHFKDLWVEEVSSPTDLKLRGNKLTLSMDTLDADKSLTIRSNGIMNDIVLCPGSSLVVVEDDINVKGLVRTNRVESDMGEDLKLCGRQVCVKHGDLVVDSNMLKRQDLTVVGHEITDVKELLEQLKPVRYEDGRFGFEGMEEVDIVSLLAVVVKALKN